MTPKQRHNLERLLNPKQVAIIGGRDAEVALKACQRIGFQGQIWPVNPNRKTMLGVDCLNSVDDLPQPPDAVFLAIPPKPALKVIKHLSQLNAGGIICYTAGFGENGSEGGESDQALVKAAGELALIGPNCYGLINYINNVSLWPFAHGGYCPGFGAAIITQSGMLSSDITMNQRSVPLAYMISAGNQSVLKLEDYIDVLCERDEVKAIGLHIEGLKDVASFSRAAYKALEHNKPIVVLKTGTSKIGAELTISHTGSLSGTKEVYQALFDRLGIISVNNPSQLLETLKFVSICKSPQGKRLIGFTCSGGGATMLADYAEKIDLDFPPPGDGASIDLKSKLPLVANVTNPLDYTTPIWGIPDKVYPVFNAALVDKYDAAIMVQDYPLEEVNESKQFYLNDAGAFIDATTKAGIPAAVCSTLPENIDLQTRQYLIESGVAPLQGIHEAMNAFKQSIWYGKQRTRCLQRNDTRLVDLKTKTVTYLSDEWRSKIELKNAGFNVPPGTLADSKNAAAKAGQIGFPVVLKVNSNQVAHKTELGGIQLGLKSEVQVKQALEQMQNNISRIDARITVDTFLVEKMLDKPELEIMVSVRHDTQFGLILTIASGGILIELVADAVTLILPASEDEILCALNRLKIAPILNGFRGAEPVNKSELVKTIAQLASYVQQHAERIAELEINPLFVYCDQTYIVDVLMQLHADCAQQ